MVTGKIYLHITNEDGDMEKQKEGTYRLLVEVNNKGQIINVKNDYEITALFNSITRVV